MSSSASPVRLGPHLDPDLFESALKRQPGWKPCFGQDDAAQLRYDPRAPDVHGLFGWLQVGEVVQVDGNAATIGDLRPWLGEHPHVRHASHMKRRNTIYVAADRVTLRGVERTLPPFR